MGDFTRYLILLTKVPGRRFTDDLIRAHVARLKELEDAGRLVACGPFTDFDGGMCILKAASREEAVAFAEADPFVASGVETFEVRTLELSCRENNHMGYGD